MIRIEVYNVRGLAMDQVPFQLSDDILYGAIDNRHSEKINPVVCARVIKASSLLEFGYSHQT